MWFDIFFELIKQQVIYEILKNLDLWEKNYLSIMKKVINQSKYADIEPKSSSRVIRFF